MAHNHSRASHRFPLTTLFRDCRGVTGFLAAASLAALCGAIGLGLDTAVWYSNAHQVQTMAEASALSAGRLLSDASQTTASISAVAKNNAALNGYASATDTVSVAFYDNTGNASPPPAATSVKVTATRTLPRMFSALFLSTNPTVSASATAGTSTSAVSLGNVCFLVLAPSTSQSLLINSSFSLNAPNCTIDVNSSSASAAMINSSLPNIAGMNVTGSYTLNGGSTVNNLQRGVAAASNPFAGIIPAPTVGSCTVNSANYSGTTNLSPGTYCGGFNFNGSGTLNLAPGTYILNGTTWNINSGWTVTGTGVTFYLVNSSSYVQFNSGVTVSLTAPSSGPYANVLMFEPDGLSASSFAIDGTSSVGHALQGLVYLPSRNVTFNSTYSGAADTFAMVVNTLIFDSNSPRSWAVSPGVSINGGSGGTVLTN